MRREYGLSLYDLPPMETARLAANLPAGSLIWQKLDVPAAWTVDQYLMAAQIDQMNLWIWANADPKKRGPQPEPRPRPGQSAGKTENARPNGQRDDEHTRVIKPVGMTIEELDRFMARDFTDMPTGTATHSE